MKRKVVIIGAEGSGESYLPGVSSDLRNYKEFFSSPAGGAWRSSEILTLNQPNFSKLKRELNNEYDYTVVVFCGHGGHDIDTAETFLEINEEETVPLSSLYPRASRQLFIIDACREELFILKSLLKIAGYRNNPEPLTSNKYINSCRESYNNLILRAPVGRSIMYSCSVGESAGDSSQGGIFSRALLEYCDNWWSLKKDDESENATVYLDVPTVLYHIRDRFDEENYPQRPHLENGKRRISYPFVIA